MRRYHRTAWQGVAVAAFAATAALSVVLTRPQPASLVEVVAACRSAGLDAWLGVAADSGAGPLIRAESTAGASVVYTLEFTNVSGQTCSLYGYPGVWAYTGDRQIGSPATLDTSIRPHVVTLAPGATAHAMLRYTRTASFGSAACRQVTVPGLRVYPPRAGSAVLVPLSIPACSREGPDFLSVEPVQPRAGIPGFPHY
ncbi:MAG: DUF4232 domain-containing protein [Streptosporangiaceae bacterium]|nr:DUF4232 domain-containing protein [Streptosporangiaceae bacterium]